MEQIFFRALFALLNDKQVVKITTTRVGDKLTLLINKDNKLITMTGNPEEVDNGIINHLKVNTEPTEQKFNVTVQDAPESDTETDGKGSKASSKKKSSHSKKKVKSSEREPAFMMKMEIGEALQPIVGKEPLARTEVTKKMWAYIKEKGLQDKKEKRTIHSDENLKKIFGGKKTVSMFELTKLVNKHLTMVKVETEPEETESKQDKSKEVEAAKEKLKEFTDTMDLGKRAMDAGNFEEAIRAYEIAVTKAPDGNTKASHDLEKAKQALNKQQADAREKELKDLMETGLKQRTDRQYEASLETFKKAKEKFPDNAEVIKQLASAEKWIKALQELTD
ncbi:MAG TPA: SWIB/MDM2 domain-containing protein [Bacteroidia bacterium]|nr:SWIB/MDM2 domain-containing protein [Bacteroidia bacterium]